MKSEKLIRMSGLKPVAALALCLGTGVWTVQASSNLKQVSTPYYTWDSGTIYGVPAGADVEWDLYADANASAQVIFDGGGLSVNRSVEGGSDGDLSHTLYADSVGYQLSANSYQAGASANGLLYVGW